MYRDIQEPMMNAASEGLGGNPFASLVSSEFLTRHHMFCSSMYETPICDARCCDVGRNGGGAVLDRQVIL